MTTAAPPRAARPAPPVPRPEVSRLVTAFVWAAVLLQRIGVPVEDGYVSPLLPLALGTAAWLWASGRAHLEPVRTALFTTALTAVLVASLAAGGLGAPLSLTSVGLLLVLYLPFVLVLTAPADAARTAVLRAVRAVATLVAVLALGQMLGQLAGVWTWTDLLAEVVPPQYLVQGYVTSYPVAYGSSLVKSNGVLLLEPSLCSQVLALGIVAHLGLGGGWRRPVLLGLALLSTVSGTGVIVLAAALLVRLVRLDARRAAGGLALALVVGAGIAASPLSAVYADRLEWTVQERSSGYQRFVAPWERMGATLGERPAVALVGTGAGSAQVAVDRMEAVLGVPAIDTPQSKLVAEYGWPAAALFVLFVGVVLVRGSPDRELAVALVALYFVLGGGLLQSQTVLLVWVLTLPFAGPGRPSAVPAPGTPWSGRRGR